MQCKSVLIRLDELRTGELEPTVAGDVKTHLQKCSSCEHTLDAINELADHVRMIKPRVQPATSILDGVRAAMADSFDKIVGGGRRAWVAFSAEGVTMIRLDCKDEPEMKAIYRARFNRELRRAVIPANFHRQIERALSGEGIGEPLVDIDARVSPFEREVLRMALSIPRGEVRTYAWLAQQLGRPKSARAVGNALARNPVPLLFPCHRVVPSAGGVGSYAFGSATKRELLRSEGVAVDDLDELAHRSIRYIGSAATRAYCFPTCRDARRITAANRIELHDEKEAAARGFHPCSRCQPLTKIA